MVGCALLAKVSRSTIAAQRWGSVKVSVQLDERSSTRSRTSPPRLGEDMEQQLGAAAVVHVSDRPRIVGANKPNTVAALDVTLTGEEIRTLEEPYCPSALLVVSAC
jgi:hypothetical protein